ncbi:flagellin C-terminal helical region, partial [Selenomonas ruminantium]
TIRDANMAKEMTEYTKYNVLTQSAQSMLAQANQNNSSVLSLLQA